MSLVQCSPRPRCQWQHLFLQLAWAASGFYSLGPTCCIGCDGQRYLCQLVIWRLMVTGVRAVLIATSNRYRSSHGYRGSYPPCHNMKANFFLSIWSLHDWSAISPCALGCCEKHSSLSTTLDKVLSSSFLLRYSTSPYNLDSVRALACPVA